MPALHAIYCATGATARPLHRSKTDTLRRLDVAMNVFAIQPATRENRLAAEPRARLVKFLTGAVLLRTDSQTTTTLPSAAIDNLCTHV